MGKFFSEHPLIISLPCPAFSSKNPIRCSLYHSSLSEILAFLESAAKVILVTSQFLGKS
jgi:hypothetical protein